MLAADLRTKPKYHALIVSGLMYPAVSGLAVFSHSLLSTVTSSHPQYLNQLN